MDKIKEGTVYYEKSVIVLSLKDRDNKKSPKK